MRITRKAFTFLLVLCAPPVLFSSAQTPKKTGAKGQYLAFVGTYTTKTTSKGIYAYRYDAGTGKLEALGVAAETADASFLVVHPNRKYLYAVNESGKSSMVSAFAVDAKSSKLALLNQVPALGEDPCYIALDKSGKYALVANYTSGNIVVFPILPDGRLGEHTALVQNSGATGPNKERQDGPHAHWIETTPDNRFALVADLGLDEVLVYKFDAAKGTLGMPPAPDAKHPFVQDALTIRPGAGPRHLAISRYKDFRQFIYVLGELDSTVTVFANSKEGVFNATQRISMLPAGFSGRNDAAEISIHPNGKFLYASNRGHESIAIFAIDPAKGTLTFVAYVPTGGKEPRHFTFDPSGNFLLAENQLSDTIVIFHVDPASGQLTPTGESVSVPSPVDMVFVPQE